MSVLNKLVLALALVSLNLAGEWLVQAQVQHVVGGDRGWDPSSGVGSWSSGRTFTIGDKIWFTYSAAEESVAELKTKEEFESCDVANPIRLYTDGIDSIPLGEEGVRYFASSNSENCKNGLKIHVDVKPRSSEITTVATSEGAAMVFAAAPVSPSAAFDLRGVSSSIALLLALVIGFCASVEMKDLALSWEI